MGNIFIFYLFPQDIMYIINFKNEYIYFYITAKTWFHTIHPSINIIYFWIYYIMKWGDLDLYFTIFHNLLPHDNHSNTWHQENMTVCLNLLIRKAHDFWLLLFLVFIAWKHEKLLFHKWSDLILYWIWSSFHFFLSLHR